MNIPNLPHPTTPLMDPHNQGSMNHAWQLYFNQLTTQLQNNTQQSLVVSSVSSDSRGTATDKMNQIAANTSNVGGLVYNADTNLLYININGTFKQIVTL